LNLLNQEALDVREKFTTEPLTRTECDSPEKRRVLVNTSLSFKILPERVLAGTIPSCANRGVPGFADIKNLAGPQGKIRVETSDFIPRLVIGCQGPPVDKGIRDHAVPRVFFALVFGDVSLEATFREASTLACRSAGSGMCRSSIEGGKRPVVTAFLK
jgi:hypothetical protein